MQTIGIRMMRAAAIASIVGVAAGCATSGQLEELRSSVLSEAQAANAKADNAVSTANAAMSAAEQAQSAADNALACCNDNTSKLDRMFEHTMRK